MTDPNYWGTKWAEQAFRYGLLPDCGVQVGKPLFCPDEKVNRSWAAYLIVQAKNLTVPYTLAQPVLISPGDGNTLAVAQPTLIWEPIADATWYHIQLADTGTLGSTTMQENEWVLATDVCTITECSWQVDAVLVNGVYDWRVRGRDTLAHLSPWSSTWEMTINLP